MKKAAGVRHQPLFLVAQWGRNHGGFVKYLLMFGEKPVWFGE
ncbi:hypothetical protein [Jeotgalibacillus salarius]|nr:hypothetical protein [Jeotgalibacillus salarius]